MKDGKPNETTLMRDTDMKSTISRYKIALKELENIENAPELEKVLNDIIKQLKEGHCTDIEPSREGLAKYCSNLCYYSVLLSGKDVLIGKIRV